MKFIGGGNARNVNANKIKHQINHLLIRCIGFGYAINIFPICKPINVNKIEFVVRRIAYGS